LEGARAKTAKALEDAGPGAEIRRRNPGAAAFLEERRVDECSPVARLMDEGRRLESARRRLDDQSRAARKDAATWGAALAEAFRVIAGPLVV
jgi:hypothetical protein